MKLTVTFMVLLSVGAMGDLEELKRKDQMVTLCGRKLAMAHHLVCSSRDKRNYDRAIFTNALDYDSWSQEDEYPFTGRRDAIGARWNRGKRLIIGLADECCLKPCTQDEIENYC